MNEIHFIKNIHFDERLASDDNRPKACSAFLRQGDLDHGCAIYSLLMMLIINKKATRYDLECNKPTKGFPSIIRLKKEFLSDIPGVYKEGLFFTDIADRLASSYAKKATATSFTTDKNIAGNLISKDELNGKIKETIDAGFPVQIGFTYKNTGGGHSVVAIGYAEYKTRMQLFCLDPGYDLPATSLWNSIVDMEQDTSTKARFTDCYLTNDNSPRNVCVDEILTID